MRFIHNHHIKLIWINPWKITIKTLVQPKGYPFRVSRRQTIKEYGCGYPLCYLRPEPLFKLERQISRVTQYQNPAASSFPEKPCYCRGNHGLTEACRHNVERSLITCIKGSDNLFNDIILIRSQFSEACMIVRHLSNKTFQKSTIPQLERIPIGRQLFLALSCGSCEFSVCSNCRDICLIERQCVNCLVQGLGSNIAISSYRFRLYNPRFNLISFSAGSKNISAFIASATNHVYISPPEMLHHSGDGAFQTFPVISV